MIARLHIVAELVLIVSVGIAVCVAVLRDREHRRRGVLLDLLPPEGATADVRAWVLFFQSLYAIAHPWWKRWLLGQPHIVLELWSEAGELGARCWAPSRLERMVSVLLRSALPGIQVRPSVAAVSMHGPATRTRLRLDRDPLHSLADPKPESLQSVMLALAEAPAAVVQLAINPDVSWQKRALR
ncbi:MAG TPA: hypothetical protein VN913_03315, partial [Candidatus Binatus sp.]|nr:hypothetical protein [Candidatus Binatus sp.]